MKIENDLAAARQELKLVSGVAPFGAHKKVADKVGISEKYSKQIRDYEGAKMPTEENLSTIKSMIKEYRKILNQERKKLEI